MTKQSSTIIKLIDIKLLFHFFTAKWDKYDVNIL